MEAVEEITGCDDSRGAITNACGGSPEVAGENSGPGKVAAQSSSVKSYSSYSLSDEFYGKLTKFYESSGLSLIFNFRETKVDLFLFYKDVTERGGYCQVTKDGKWGEVASALNTKSDVLIPPTKIQMIYANLFYQFEQTYYYRTPAKVTEGERLRVDSTGSGSGDSSSSSTGKRKHCESDNGTVDKRVCLKSSFQLPTVLNAEEKNPVLQTPSEEKNPVLQTPKKIKETKKSSIIKEMKKYPNAPMRYRTGYMIFLRMECDRLKKIHGESSAGQFRDMAIDAWRHLSKNDREPYVEASKKDKERFIREMAAYENMYKQNTETQNAATSTKSTSIIDFVMPNLQTNDDYHVSLPADDDYHVSLPADVDENFATDESMVELAAGIMQNAQPNDPLFQVNWDEYYESLDVVKKE